jgi:hypothetical protein
MAIKGLSYNKTIWAFEERPVSSAKLNQWDDRIEAALEAAFLLLNHAWGGGDGVLHGVGSGELAVTATSPLSLRVSVGTGYAFIDGSLYRLKTTTQTADVVPPLVHGRIDLVQANLATWSVSVKTGTEAAIPVAPSVDDGVIPLARLVLRPGMASIKDTDDTVNGYVVDVRSFL